MGKRNLRILSLFSLILGIILLLNSKTKLTGSVIGESGTSSTIIFVIGISLIITSIIIFVIGQRLEERSFKESPSN